MRKALKRNEETDGIGWGRRRVYIYPFHLLRREYHFSKDEYVKLEYGQLIHYAPFNFHLV